MGLVANLGLVDGHDLLVLVDVRHVATAVKLLVDGSVGTLGKLLVLEHWRVGEKG